MERNQIKLVAVDIDGTFVHSDYTYDVPRFQRILSRMKKAGCNFVVASGNQYYQLQDLFFGYDEEISFVAENGAFVKDRQELVFAADIPKETVELVIDICAEYPDVINILCGVESAYCKRGNVSREFMELTDIYYRRLRWVDEIKEVIDRDQIVKFALSAPEEKTYDYYDMFRERLKGKMEPTTSGHGSIDLIMPGCHKASGIARLVERFGILPKQCAAFGDGGNDIEMLSYCGYSYAMENAPQNVKDAAKYICPSNEEDGVLVTLEEIFA